MSVSLALHAHVTTAATLVCNTPCSALHSTAQMNGSQAEQQLPGPAAQSLLVQLLLLLSMLYLGILCRFNLAWVLSAACTVVCAVAAWQWLSKERSAVRTHASRTNGSANTPQQPQPRATQGPKYPQTHNLTGIWIKDKEASDSMQETFDVMHINKFVRGAVGLVKGTELKQIEDSFEIAVLSGILWFRITERYPFSGEVQQFKRRDLRKGMHRGTVQKLDDGAVCVTLEWDPPLGGLGTDIFYTIREDLMYVDSTILMNGRLIKYRTVYTKLKQ